MPPPHPAPILGKPGPSLSNFIGRNAYVSCSWSNTLIRLSGIVTQFVRRALLLVSMTIHRIIGLSSAQCILYIQCFGGHSTINISGSACVRHLIYFFYILLRPQLMIRIGFIQIRAKNNFTHPFNPPKPLDPHLRQPPC